MDAGRSAAGCLPFPSLSGFFARVAFAPLTGPVGGLGPAQEHEQSGLDIDEPGVERVAVLKDLIDPVHGDGGPDPPRLETAFRLRALHPGKARDAFTHFWNPPPRKTCCLCCPK